MREKILTFIEKNSRIDLKELAIILGVDEAAVVNELQKMEEEHIICGYHTLIDWDKAGIEKVTALIEVRVTPQRGMGFDKVAERIYNYPEVNSVYLISGGFDFMVTIEGKTLREVSQFVSNKLSPLDSVLSTKTNFILKKYPSKRLNPRTYQFEADVFRPRTGSKERRPQVHRQDRNQRHVRPDKERLHCCALW